MTYRIREVDGGDDDIAETLADLHRLTFFGEAPTPDFENGHWWLAHLEKEPVAFAGIVKSTHIRSAYYFSRVGVLKVCRGHGLQRRLMRALESKAYRAGAQRIVSDTTDNIPSANNFIQCGYSMFQPDWPWSFPQSIYWSKEL